MLEMVYNPTTTTELKSAAQFGYILHEISNRVCGC